MICTVSLYFHALQRELPKGLTEQQLSRQINLHGPDNTKNCSCVFAEGKDSAWDSWVRPLLEKALSLAPLDFGDVWGVGLRYALYNLSTTSVTGFKAVLQIVSRPISAGMASPFS